MTSSPRARGGRRLRSAGHISLRWQRWLGIAAVVCIVVGVVVLALLDHPVFASRVFSVCLTAVALVRFVLRRRKVWFAARAWWIDCLVLLLLAAGLAYLSFYGGRVMPTTLSGAHYPWT